MSHPYKDILIAIANGEKVQWQSPTGSWIDSDASDVLCDVAHPSEPFDVYRIKPKTININGHEIPEPVREPLTKGQSYFIPDLATRGAGSCEWLWHGDTPDLLWLERGLVHLTKEAAKAHAEALLSFTRS
jgi:hypothetical protein